MARSSMHPSLSAARRTNDGGIGASPPILPAPLAGSRPALPGLEADEFAATKKLMVETFGLTPAIE
jgi:hypothetical protein